MKKLLSILMVILLAMVAHGQEVKKVKITDLEKTIAESKTPLIINFWATWCIPCLEEIPYFMEEAKLHKNDSLQLILVSLDMKDAFPVQIKKTIVKRKITVPVQWLDETNADYFCPKIDSAWSGVMPATLLINNKSGFRSFFEEQVPREQLEAEILKLVKN